jgi:Protein of unknown function (DUF3551)
MGGDRATAPIEYISCEKIRGCSCMRSGASYSMSELTWINIAHCLRPQRCADFEEVPMRTLALTILTAAMVLAGGQAQAQTYGLPPLPTGPDSYCLQGRIWGYPGNCQFSSYAQCMATASGTSAYCGINPQYAFARQRRGPYRDRY